MGIPRDVSPFGSQTVTGPGWPNIEEEALASAAAEYEAFATKLSGSVVPQQTSQLTSLTGEWTGLGATSASREATSIIGGHEANATQAAATALKLRAMEAAVARTKTLVNATALEVQRECELLAAMPFGNTQELIQSRIKMGLSQNIAYVNANTAELAASLGTPPILHNPGAPPTATLEQASQKGAKEAGQQGGQMMGQMIGLATQLPGQIIGAVTQMPQQLMQPLQQLSQPLQQLTSLFGGKGGGSPSPSPFSAFSNHPAAGGSGAGGGGGMTRAASVPGSGGMPAQTPAMANLVGTGPAAGARVPGAAGGGVAGLAPVGSGMGGGMGMMPQRGSEGAGGTAASLAAPAALDYDLDEDVDDDW